MRGGVRSVRVRVLGAACGMLTSRFAATDCAYASLPGIDALPYRHSRERGLRFTSAEPNIQGLSCENV
ncbi:hypothetical protein [Lysobacter gummosus]|uniref:hypothetical protein n=1 Tax=Lysobacter gummosus TaxID=262324 RepID=UPI003630CEBF